MNVWEVANILGPPIAGTAFLIVGLSAAQEAWKAERPAAALARFILGLIALFWFVGVRPL